MDRKNSVFDIDEHKKIMLEYCVNNEEFEKTMKEFTTVMARNDMGGNEGIHKIENSHHMELLRRKMGGVNGIHKPTSGNPDRLRR